MNIYEKINETKEFIMKQSPLKPGTGIVLGSGLGAFAETLSEKQVIPFKEIPNFMKVSIKGHAGKLIIGKVRNRPVVVMQGRYHYYEGHDISEVVFPIRSICSLGIKNLLLTNAAGGINPEFAPGDLMIIRDHINLMGINPLRGNNDERIGPRFPDLSDVYSKDLIRIIGKNMRAIGLEEKQGVYLALSGPTYETPSEIKMLSTLGADAVGMSTVPEAITARHMGVNVAGISCITNLAAGISKTKLDHKEVTETADRIKDDFIKLLDLIIPEF